ncbi:hypothetical protein, partial [Endozoicomonas sp. SESOKO2]|uniref:hypothetical protein n=1 Tax=Endozoicomonas sp. SESOKO2 TaxID=2828743 RepID=UPI002147A316
MASIFSTIFPVYLAIPVLNSCTQKRLLPLQLNRLEVLFLCPIRLHLIDCQYFYGLAKRQHNYVGVNN